MGGYWGFKEGYFVCQILNKSGILVDQTKIEAVMQLGVPKTPFEIRNFLGLVGYYRWFIQDFSKKIVPLTRLTEKNVVFRCSEEQHVAFETLNQNL